MTCLRSFAQLFSFAYIRVQKFESALGLLTV